MLTGEAGNSRLRTARAPQTILLAIAALVGWLAAVPASAQPAQPEAPAGPIRGAGKSATTPSADRTERKELLIGGSSGMRAVPDAVLEPLIPRYPEPAPDVPPPGAGTR